MAVDGPFRWRPALGALLFPLAVGCGGAAKPPADPSRSPARDTSWEAPKPAANVGTGDPKGAGQAATAKATGAPAAAPSDAPPKRERPVDRQAVMLAGALVFIGGYASTLVYASARLAKHAGSEYVSLGSLALPIAGPFVVINQGEPKGGYVAADAVLGSVQLAAAGLIVVGWLLPEGHHRPDAFARTKSIEVTPLLGVGQVGVAASF